jgi:hypothetical protein
VLVSLLSATVTVQNGIPEARVDARLAVPLNRSRGQVFPLRAAKVLTMDKARRVASNIAKLPTLLSQTESAALASSAFFDVV